MMNLFLNWQDEETRRWYTVGRLSCKDGEYKFVYTKGAEEAFLTKKFTPFGRMKDMRKVYSSDELFPLFSNRILSKSRQDYVDYLKWMDIEETDPNPLDILARSGGERATDNLQVYPEPQPSFENKYKALFFVHGIRHLNSCVIEMINELKAGDPLYPMHDMANEHDKEAIALRKNDPAFMIGYSPRYLAPDIRRLYQESPDSFNIRVRRVNSNAPFQMRVLCEVEAFWPKSFKACENNECIPLAGD